MLRYYRDQYHFFGDAQVMCVKLLWDYAFYWAMPALWFFHDRWTDLEFMASVEEEYSRAIELTARMQQLFREWHAADGREWRNSFVTLFPYLLEVSDELDDQLDDEALRAKCTRDLAALEAFVVTAFEKAARLVADGGRLDLKQPVNPYAVTLDRDRWDEEGVFNGSGTPPREARKLVKGLQFAWLDEFGSE